MGHLTGGHAATHLSDPLTTKPACFLGNDGKQTKLRTEEAFEARSAINDHRRTSNLQQVLFLKFSK